jgi:hypothetical protein
MSLAIRVFVDNGRAAPRQGLVGEGFLTPPLGDEGTLEQDRDRLLAASCRLRSSGARAEPSAAAAWGSLRHSYHRARAALGGRGLGLFLALATRIGLLLFAPSGPEAFGIGLAACLGCRLGYVGLTAVRSPSSRLGDRWPTSSRPRRRSSTSTPGTSIAPDVSTADHTPSPVQQARRRDRLLFAAAVGFAAQTVSNNRPFRVMGRLGRAVGMVVNGLFLLTLFPALQAVLAHPTRRSSTPRDRGSRAS